MHPLCTSMKSVTKHINQTRIHHLLLPSSRTLRNTPVHCKTLPIKSTSSTGSVQNPHRRISPSCHRWLHACAPSRRPVTIDPDIPSVTLAEMKRLLKQKGMAVEDGYTSLAVACALCEGTEKGTMFINKTTGYFLCPRCLQHGEWSLLERALRRGREDDALREHLQLLRAQTRAFAELWRRVTDATRPVGELAEHEARHLCDLFRYPYYAECVRALAEVRCDAPRTALYFPLKNSLDTVVGYRKVEAGQEGRPETAGHAAAGVFSARAARPARGEQAVLVPAVADVLCLHREKVPGRLVWWTDGLLPPPLLPALEAHPRVVVWGGAGSVRGVGDKLQHERCRFVRPTEGAGSAREAAESRQGLRAVVAAAAPAAHRAVTTFAALRDDVYADLINAEKVRGVKWKRFPALTRLLGGHRRGELTVLTGPTGCGKTTLTAEMSLDLATEGVNTLWGSFEIRNSRLARTMLQQHAGVPLERHLADFGRLADEFQRLPIYFLAFHGPQPVATVMEAVEHARYVHDIAHVVVDNVQFMLGLPGGERGAGDRYLRQDEVVAAFRTLATRRDCHVTLVMHPRKEREAEDLSTSSIFGSAKASQEADNVLIIQDKRLTAIRGKKFLQVAKNRFSGDLGVVPLEFDKAALSYQTRKRPAKDKEGAEDHRQEGEERSSHRQESEEKPTGSKKVSRDKSKGGDSFLSDILDKDR